MTKEERKIIEFVAEIYEEETEYDGRVEHFCFYCKEEQKRGGYHKEDCLHLLAKKLLRDELKGK